MILPYADLETPILHASLNHSLDGLGDVALFEGLSAARHQPVASAFALALASARSALACSAPSALAWLYWSSSTFMVLTISLNLTTVSLNLTGPSALVIRSRRCPAFSCRRWLLAEMT